MPSLDAIIDCVTAAALGTFVEALALARRRFEECRQSTASRALRHLFFAERGARSAAKGRTVEQVGVLSAGTMGSGIAISLASALADALERVRAALDAGVAKGRMSRAAADAAKQRVQGRPAIEDLRDVFASLGAICRPGAVLASNTSTLDIDAIAAASGLDVGYRVRRERRDLPDDPRYYRVADLLVEQGRLGQKSGRGAFIYPDGARRPVRDPQVEELIESEARRLQIDRRAIADDEIRDRGGPMFYADTLGPALVLVGIRRLAGTHGARDWTEAPLLVELVDRSENFTAWQKRRGTAAEVS